MLTEELTTRIKNKIYFMKPEDLVYGYQITENLEEDFNVKLKEKLIKLMREEKEEKK